MSACYLRRPPIVFLCSTSHSTWLSVHTHTYRHTHTVTTDTHWYSNKLTDRRMCTYRHKKTGRMIDEYPSSQTHTHTFFSSPLSLLPAVSHHLFFPSKSPMDIWTPETCSFSLCKCTHTLTHTPFPIHAVGQQVYWILMISGPASPWLISGCRFSVVYLILSFCLHPSIVSPCLPAFVRNKGGHLPSVPLSPSSHSNQTTVEPSVRLWKGKTLFACVSVRVSVDVCVCVG